MIGGLFFLLSLIRKIDEVRIFGPLCGPKETVISRQQRAVVREIIRKLIKIVICIINILSTFEAIDRNIRRGITRRMRKIDQNYDFTAKATVISRQKRAVVREIIRKLIKIVISMSN